ncbi:MAG: hypothetical protein ABL916_11525 [Burkholderiaceae bacterium]
MGHKVRPESDPRYHPNIDVVSVGDARNFDNGRQFAAWLGVVHRECV